MTIDVSRLAEFDDHESVLTAHDPKTGLHAVVAIHNTNRGPAAGATRYWRYVSEKAAMRDALRLARGMTYKCALADVPFGGGKAVIMADPRHPKNAALLRSYVEVIDSFGGNFYTGQDVGMTHHDVKVMARTTKYVIGKSPESDDPPYWTALGILAAMRAAAHAVFGCSDLAGRTVAIKGVGNVGFALAKLLGREGARLIVADIDPKKIARARTHLPGIKIISSARIHKERADVYAPCALGGEFTNVTARAITAPVVCGGANNQLAHSSVGKILEARSILYVPDYLANAGGLINVVAELAPGGYDRRAVERKTLAIGDTAARIIDLARRTRRPTNEVADQLAEKIFRPRKKAR